MKPRRRAFVVVVIFIAGCGALAGRRAWLPSFAQWLDVGSDLQHVDVVLALPGDAERRPFVAAAIVKVGFAERALVIENGFSPDEHDGIVPRSHDVLRKIYEARGLSPAQILLSRGSSTSTADDLDAVRRYLDENRQSSVCIVTSAYHTRRTRSTVQTRLPQYSRNITIFSAPNPGFDWEDWWQTPEGLEFILSEYLKLGWYFLRFGRGWVVIVSICVLMAVTTYAFRRRDFTPTTSAA